MARSGRVPNRWDPPTDSTMHDFTKSIPKLLPHHALSGSFLPPVAASPLSLSAASPLSLSSRRRRRRRRLGTRRRIEKAKAVARDELGVVRAVEGRRRQIHGVVEAGDAAD
uniref:Uncharacterized protein n=1 Tax=Oryza glumipatula TaxID=40148 RepID=A0A0D9Z4M2_9ORYZ